MFYRIISLNWLLGFFIIQHPTRITRKSCFRNPITTRFNPKTWLIFDRINKLILNLLFLNFDNQIFIIFKLLLYRFFWLLILIIKIKLITIFISKFNSTLTNILTKFVNSIYVSLYTILLLNHFIYLLFYWLIL